MQWLKRRLSRKSGEAEVPYMLPRDFEETSRIDFLHFLIRYLIRGNYVSPIHNPGSILDVGSGTGRWCIEMARQFPNANIVGIDNNPPFMDTSGLPPENYTFVEGDVLEGLPFNDSSFDFIHQSFLGSSIPLDHWQKNVDELVRVLRPNGWIELLETGLFINGSNAVNSIQSWMITVFQTQGIDLLANENIAKFLHQNGKLNVKSNKIIVPVGPSAGRVGIMVKMDMLSVYRAIKTRIVDLGIVTAQEFDSTLREVESEINQGDLQWPLYIAFGQRVQ